MGKFDFAHLGQTKPRTVPTSAMEYAINRNAYHAQVGALRMQFKQEWAARKQREAVAAACVRALWPLGKPHSPFSALFRAGKCGEKWKKRSESGLRRSWR